MSHRTKKNHLLARVSVETQTPIKNISRSHISNYLRTTFAEALEETNPSRRELLLNNFHRDVEGKHEWERNNRRNKVVHAKTRKHRSRSARHSTRHNARHKSKATLQRTRSNNRRAKKY